MAVETAQQPGPCRGGQPRHDDGDDVLARRDTGHVLGQHERLRVDQRTSVVQVALAHEQDGNRLGQVPAGPLGTPGDLLVGRPAQQVDGQSLELALREALDRGELVGVPGDAGGGQLVDVGEHQLGELGEHVGGHACLDRLLGQAAPRDAGTDAVGGQQGVHAAAAACLTAAQAVARLEGGAEGRAGVVRAGGDGRKLPSATRTAASMLPTR